MIDTLNDRTKHSISHQSDLVNVIEHQVSCYSAKPVVEARLETKALNPHRECGEAITKALLAYATFIHFGILHKYFAVRYAVGRLRFPGLISFCWKENYATLLMQRP